MAQIKVLMNIRGKAGLPLVKGKKIRKTVMAELLEFRGKSVLVKLENGDVILRKRSRDCPDDPLFGTNTPSTSAE